MFFLSLTIEFSVAFNHHTLSLTRTFQKIITCPPHFQIQLPFNDQDFLNYDWNPFSVTIQWSTCLKWWLKPSFDHHPMINMSQMVSKVSFQLPYVRRPKLFFGCPRIHYLFFSDQMFGHLWSPNVAFNESFPKTYYMHPFPNSVIGDRKFSITTL
jgi:hypothetical protein